MRHTLSIVALLSALLLFSCRGPAPAEYILGTYNVHHCEPPVGGGRVYDGISDLIRTLGPDAVALQELDSCNARSGGFQARELAARTGMEYLYHRTIEFGGGSYGIGMLYRPSLQLIRSEFLPLPGEEPRGAIVAEFARFVYVCTHLCPQSRENRTLSMGILESWIAERYNDSGKPVFIAGDLNSPDILEGTHSFVPFSTTEATFLHDGEPLGEGAGKGARIDYIVRFRSRAGEMCTLQHSVVPQPSGIQVDSLSDHRPVLSFVKIR